MLVTIAAAVLALAPAERQASKAVPYVLTAPERKPVTACRAAGRMQVQTEPTLLYRPDPDVRVRKLIEMPMAQGCLLGGTR